ncbi:MAG TPA: hypothetical protein VHL57_01185 [Flavobacteriales bacterium]|nr:hypothetical protein [Flavobacteriales bacterium]
MGKLQDKRIELAKKILDTTDPATLAIVEDALSGKGHYQFSPEQVKEFEAIRERMRSSKSPSYSWAEVKKRARGRLAK